MVEKIFTESDAWTGGYFELLAYFGTAEADKIKAALSCLWSHHTLSGCWLEPDNEPSIEMRIQPSNWTIDSTNILRGIATLPNGRKCACLSNVIVDEDGAWIYFGVPLGSLGRAYDVGAYPFEDKTDHQWITPLSNWLALIGDYVNKSVEVKTGVTGFITTIEVDEVIRIQSGEIPKDRWNGYLRNENGCLVWYPPNMPSAPMT